MNRLAFAAAIGVGMCLGFAILVRVVSVFFVPGFLVLLWPRQWRRAITGFPAAVCLAVLLSGFVPLFVHQQLTGGSWNESTYSPSVPSPARSTDNLRMTVHDLF